MANISPRLVGVELYFDDLVRAKRFYTDTLGLQISDESPGHHAKFDCGAGFVCLERKGSESYRSRDKAFLFFEVVNLRSPATSGTMEPVQFTPAALCGTSGKWRESAGMISG
jgi:catechol 2,3-dioxygenase-like lactoylglutathione lyase family enzyme